MPSCASCASVDSTAASGQRGLLQAAEGGRIAALRCKLRRITTGPVCRRRRRVSRFCGGMAAGPWKLKFNNGRRKRGTACRLPPGILGQGRAGQGSRSEPQRAILTPARNGQIADGPMPVPTRNAPMTHCPPARRPSPARVIKGSHRPPKCSVLGALFLVQPHLSTLKLLMPKAWLYWDAALKPHRLTVKPEPWKAAAETDSATRKYVCRPSLFFPPPCECPRRGPHRTFDAVPCLWALELRAPGRPFRGRPPRPLARPGHVPVGVLRPGGLVCCQAIYAHPPTTTRVRGSVVISNGTKSYRSSGACCRLGVADRRGSTHSSTATLPTVAPDRCTLCLDAPPLPVMAI